MEKFLSLVDLYRVRHVVVDLGWDDFDIYFPLYCLAQQSILLDFQQPKQMLEGSGTPQINVNPT